MPDILKPKSSLIPDWIKDPSVMDSAPKRVAGSVLRALGIDGSPESGLPTPAALGVAMMPPKYAKTRGAYLLDRARKDQSFPTHIQEALEFAQKRWPRVFGHTASIESRALGGSKGVSVTNTPFTEMVRSRFPEIQKNTGILTRIALDPNEIPDKEDALKVIGHELLHGADRIADQNFDETYRFASQLPARNKYEAYAGQSQEVRARLQGARLPQYAKGIPRKDFETAVHPYDYHDIEHTPTLDNRISNIDMPTQKPTFVDPKSRLADILLERQELARQGRPTPRVPPQSK